MATSAAQQQPHIIESYQLWLGNSDTPHSVRVVIIELPGGEYEVRSVSTIRESNPNADGTYAERQRTPVTGRKRFDDLSNAQAEVQKQQEDFNKAAQHPSYYGSRFQPKWKESPANIGLFKIPGERSNTQRVNEVKKQDQPRQKPSNIPDNRVKNTEPEKQQPDNQPQAKSGQPAAPVPQDNQAKLEPEPPKTKERLRTQRKMNDEVKARIKAADTARKNIWSTSKTVDVYQALTKGRPLNRQPQAIQDYWNEFTNPQHSMDRLKTFTGVGVATGVAAGVGLIALEAGAIASTVTTVQTTITETNAALMNLYSNFPRAYTAAHNFIAGLAEAPAIAGPGLVPVGVGAYGVSAMASHSGIMAKFAPFITMGAKWGQHRHHLVLKMIFKRADSRLIRALEHEIPAVYMSAFEHLSKLHPKLNRFLKQRGVWRDKYTKAQVKEAIETIAEFYASEGKMNWAQEVWGFLGAMERAGLL